jgi:antitoxin component YwqK of YwqJK toxin-antitoxin module
MTKKPETVKEEDLIKRKDGLVYKKYAKVPFTGVYESFHEYGRVKEKGKTPYTYSNRQLVSYQNYTNGHLKEKGIYKNGKPHGTFEWFKTNGQLEEKINFQKHSS